VSSTTSQLICPKCQGPMRSYERSGITVDQCTECRGVFLDRGELERLIDAESAPRHEREDRQPDDHGRRPSEHERQGKRRGSFLSELFE
jgi:uncharacterized protein